MHGKIYVLIYQSRIFVVLCCVFMFEATVFCSCRLLDVHCRSLEAPVDWENICLKAVEHITSDCPVCLVPLHTPAHHHPSMHHKSHPSHPHKSHSSYPHMSHSSQPLRPLAILSCGHLLHVTCIEALEKYSFETVHICPLCRAPYHRKEFTPLSDEKQP